MPLEALDALPDGVVVAGSDRTVTAVSTVAAAMLGVDRDECSGRLLADVLALRDSDGRHWYDVNCPYDGLQTRTGVPEQSWLLPDGSEVLVVAKIHRPALDRPVSQVAVSIRSGRGRERLDRARSDLVATVAHELRSPLTGVKGFVQALINRWDKLNDAQKLLMLTTALTDADRLSRLIAELLDVARIDTGRLQLHPRPVDVGTIVERVCGSVGAGTSRQIKCDVGPDLPQVAADRDKLTQVVTNLLENAVVHGAGLVSVTVDPLGPEGESTGIRLVVQDEGPGIPADLRHRVFTKFWTGSPGSGSGLGLYVVNGLVRAHGGTIRIDDAPGGGARITVEWPSAQD